MAKRRKKRASATAPRPRRSAPNRSRKPRSSDSAKKTVAVLTRELDEVRQQLSEALEQQTASSEVLQVISGSSGELEPVFRAMLESATRICEAKFGLLFRYDSGRFYPSAGLGTPPALAEFQRQRGWFSPLPESVLDRVVRTLKVAHSIDDAAGPNPSAPARLGGARSTVAVPMLKDDKLVGAIVIYRQEVRPFTHKQIELVQNFANQAVIAIENTRLLNELRESLQQQTATSEVLQVISSSPGELQPVFETMLANATRICEAKFGTLTLFEGDELRMVAMHGAPREFEELRRRDPRVPIAVRRVEQKHMWHIADLAAEATYANSPLVKLAGARSFVGAPLLKDNEVIGNLSIYRQEVRPFTDKQIELLTSFAS
jgi:GAF domain-containing protein